ncbi:MAG TPA: peptidase M14 [Thioalkalivibrio sp.]|nr:peptidase M14 [Thioalkalivibrio sp.]
MLTETDTLPDGLLTTGARDLHTVLDGPTLVHLPGRRAEPLFVSVLLHGNEDTGLVAVQELLARYREQELPRALSLFIGNIAAAREARRRLDGQPDYNRCWPGTELEASDETRMMAYIVETMRQRRAFASVDVHNNTGLNPHYACINRLDNAFLQLATLFGRTVVYFIRPRGVASMAMAEVCPSTTLECGKPGQAHGVEHAVEYLDACLHLSEIPVHPVNEHDIDLFHTVAQVKVPERFSFSFGHSAAHIAFDPELERMNFREVPTGTEFGVVDSQSGAHLAAYDEAGLDVTEAFFEIREQRILLRRAMMPSMLTLDERVVRQDCLCYLMERMGGGA